MFSDPIAVFLVDCPSTLVKTIDDDAPAGSEIVAEETRDPSGSRILPKSASTGADPSSVSTFSDQEIVNLSIKPSAFTSSASSVAICGAAPSAIMRSPQEATGFPEISRRPFAVPDDAEYEKRIPKSVFS